MMDKIGLIGIGKLGICFALNLERVGYEVLGVDIDEGYVRQINDKTFKSNEPQVSEYLKTSENFKATANIEEVIESGIELIFIFVATPSLPDGSYDHTQVDRVLERIKKRGKQDKIRHLVIGCTVMPGYTDHVVPDLEKLNYTLSYNPEFIAQGTIIKDQQQPDQVLIGQANKEAGDKIEAVYSKLCRNKPQFCRMDRKSAEIAKLATNCFLTMKISFANSIGDLAESTGADTEKVLSAVGADSRIGSKYLDYGYGFGGPCFPRDNRALLKYARSAGMDLPLSAATDKVNEKHFQFQLEQWLKKFDKDETIVFNGVAYKRGAVLLEESQQLKLAIALAEKGRKVKVRDIQPVIDQVRDIYGDLFEYETIAGF